jgi:hypothetical protein
MLMIEKYLNEYSEEEILFIVSGDDGVRKTRHRPQNQEFKNNQDLIFSGCSQTHGDHISPPLVKDGNHEKIWGFLVSDHLKVDATNLGVLGYSAYSIVNSLLYHFSIYGNPQVLMCLFPDLWRFQGPKDKGIKPTNLKKKDDVIQRSFHEPEYQAFGSEMPQYSKSPHFLQEILPPAYPLYYNLQSMLLLEQYCKSNNIKYVYATWHTNSEQVILESKELYKKHRQKEIYTNFITTNCGDWNDYSPEFKNNLTCHKELQKSYPNLFEIGYDKLHMGMHRHAHIAEYFIKGLEEIYG